MTIPHGLAGKAYVGTLYALLIIASLIALAVVAFGPFEIVVIIGAVMAVGFIGFALLACLREAERRVGVHLEGSKT
jgi:hypothetical protein